MSESRTAVVHIINKFKVKNKSQAFRCVMIYQDLSTKYCFVKPLLYKIEIEIVMELFKIITSYGPPNEIHVNSCTQEMVNNIESLIENLCPMFNIRFIKKNGENNDIAMTVVTELHKWMESTKMDEWEIGCSIIQLNINTGGGCGGTRSPQQLLFKHLSESSDSEHSAGVDRGCREEIKAEPDTEPDAATTEDSGGRHVRTYTHVGTMKREVVDWEVDTSTLKQRAIEFEGGLIFPGFGRKEGHTDVEVKMERLDE